MEIPADEKHIKMANEYNDILPWIRKHRIGGHTSLIPLKDKKTFPPLNQSYPMEIQCKYGPLIPIEITEEQKPNYSSKYLVKL